MTITERLRALDISLPEAPQPLGAYIPSVKAGNLVFVSGTLPLREGKVLYPGKLGLEVSLEEGVAASRIALLNSLAILRQELGQLERINQIVKLGGFVASAPGFSQQPLVLNGASNLLFELFGEKGRHARSAVGVAELPLNAPVEIDLIVQFG